MRLRLLLAAVVLGLLGSLSAVSASATPVTNVVPLLPAPHNMGCNPLGVPFCSHGYNQELANEVAWHWSDTHTHLWQRRPVPYPSNYNYLRYYHTVYVVEYQYRDARRQVWKYGITRQTPYTDRANVGRRDCERFFGTNSGYRCTVNWLAVTNFNHGWYWARYLEASLIKQWNLHHPGQRCPRGQYYSCM